MDKRNYTSHFLLQNEAYRYTLPISTLLCIAILFILEHTIPFVPTENALLIYNLQNYSEIVPVMLLTSLSGYAMGGVAVLVFFTIETIATHNFAYHAFLLLLASLLSNLPIMRGWYKSIRKTVFTAILFSLVLGNGWNGLLAILEGHEIQFEAEQFHFFAAVPPSIAVCIFCAFYFNRCPAKIRDLFFTSSYESKDVQAIRKMLKQRKYFGIDERLSIFILVCSLSLIVAGFGFANALVEDFKLGDWDSIVFATRLTILMAIIGTPVIMLTVSLTNQSITNPLMLMAEAAENSYICRMESPHEKSANTPLIDLKLLDIKSKDEIGILYEALVRAFENTNAYIENLEKEKQLETQLLSAEAANKAKSAFLSNMSHEIRTPINAVLGLDEMILRESSEPEIKKYAVDIESAGRSLLSIVNDILDFSKIEAGKMEIVPANYHLSSLVNDLVNMISKRAQDKNLALHIDIDKTIPHLLFGDDVRIKQCILNILTNAVKYTKTGSVTLSIKGENRSDQHIYLNVHVIDTGIGIKEEDLPKLFTAFQRIEENKNRTIEGTGLGMNIVKNLLNLMDSKLEVQSVYGKGSDFSFSVRQRVVDWEPIGDFNDIYKKSLQDIVKYKEGFHAPNAKILVVDDTELNLTVVKGLLKQTQIQIETAKSGQETLELVVKQKYDMIFLDHRMPGMDGIETFRAMNALATNLNHGVPCIALTANAISGAKEMYLEAGFTDYLSKPIESKKLEDMLVKYLPSTLIEPCDEKELPKSEELSPECQAVKTRFAAITGISLADAIKYTGNADILEQTLKEFYCSIDEKAAAIEQFAAAQDFVNYTVLVHALKSSARLIGALELSADALYLEKCGDSKNADEIAKKTPALLQKYRSYKEHLAPICPKDDTAQKEEMSEAQYNDAMKSIKECAEAFDFDTIDTILSLLAPYRPPAERAAEFAALEKAIRNVDQAHIIQILS